MIAEAPLDESSSSGSWPDRRYQDSGTGGKGSFDHEPVMAAVIVDVFSSVPAGVILDGTLGGGGHAGALLESRSDIAILGIDRDAEAIRAATESLRPFASRVCAYRGRFDDVSGAMAACGVDSLSGALFDLGVSSHQFDSPDRGFSYRFEAPLDMRMDQRQKTTAADIVNESSVEDLRGILRTFADEKFADRIARAIVCARPISTTKHLSDVVAAAIPAPARRRGGHPAKRTFQALRIAVNEELAVIPGALDAAVASVVSGGRIAVLSYHSGEDRIVKERFGHFATGGCICPAELPCVCGAQIRARKVRVAARPSSLEISSNPRSSSARLRVVEVL